MVQAMKVRGDLFLKEVKRVAAEKDSQHNVSLTLAVVGMFGKIRLVAGAHMVDENCKKIQVSHVLLQAVGERDQDAINRLYEGTGTISNEIRGKVQANLISFIARLKESNGLLTSITYGRGLMFISYEEGEAFKQAIETSHGKPIVWIPDINHAVDDALGS